MNGIIFIFYHLNSILILLLYFINKTDCFIPRFQTFSISNNRLTNIFNNYNNYNTKFTHTNPFILHSRRSIETVIHTDDYQNYDPNCIKYRKAKYWREKSDEELQEEIRKIRKVLRKIEECIKIKDPSLLPDSKRNAKRTQAQLLFLLHERYLNSIRNSSNNTIKTNK